MHFFGLTYYLDLSWPCELKKVFCKLIEALNHIINFRVFNVFAKKLQIYYVKIGYFISIFEVYDAVWHIWHIYQNDRINSPFKDN